MAIAKVLTPESKFILDRLYATFVVATDTAGKMLAKHGMESREFAEADHAAGEIMEQINKLLGRRTWMG